MHKRNYGYVEGYVDGRDRGAINPYNPDVQVIEEIIIVPPQSGSGGLLYVQYVSSVNVTTLNGALITSETFSFAPLASGDVYITVNGISIYPANGAAEVSISAFYITDQTGTIIRPKGTYQINDRFHWNGSVAQYELESDDQIKIIYQV